MTLVRLWHKPAIGQTTNYVGTRGWPSDSAPCEGPEYVDQWRGAIRELHRAAKAWDGAKQTGDFGSIVRLVSRQTSISKEFGRWTDRQVGRIETNILLREDPISGVRLCIRPTTLLNAIWTQLAQAIDCNESLGSCNVCKKWFAIKTVRGRYAKEFAQMPARSGLIANARESVRSLWSRPTVSRRACQCGETVRDGTAGHWPCRPLTRARTSLSRIPGADRH
jgi:hypothetical protein